MYGLLILPAIASAQLQITTTTVPVATQYQSYSTTLTATGGTRPYTWSVVSSTTVSLPEGMTLNPSTGVVSATMVAGQGGYAVTVQVSDSASPAPNVATATLNFGVNSDGSMGGCQMFPADSIYNQRADQLPVDTNPSHQIPSGYLPDPIHPDFGHGFYPIPGGIPFMRVPANQPLTNVLLSTGGQIDGNGIYAWPFPAYPNAAIETTNYGPDGEDHHILILQSSVNNITGPQTGPCVLYETYQDTPVQSMFNAATNTWTVLSGVHYVLNSNEIAASAATLDNGAQDSPGIPMVPLLIRYSEVPLGVNHPLRISWPSPTNGWVWPGTGCCGGSGPPQGLLYRLKASVNWQATCPVSSFPQAATVLQALQQYGAYMSDHGSPAFIQGVPDVRWNDDDLACIKHFHASDLEVVDNSMLEVFDLSGQTKPYVVPTTLPGAASGTSYSATISVVGGNPATRQWSVSSGSLPGGLLLNASTGTISGMPSSSSGSPFNFTITATDTASGLSSQAQAFSISVSGGATPPSIPQNVTAAAVSSSQINVSWSASSAGSAPLAGYHVYRNGSLAGTVTTTSFSDTGLAPSTTYSYTVTAYDSSGNPSAPSSPASATTMSIPDTTPPTVSITSPAANSMVSNTVTVSATASDNVAVADVQFQLDGVNLGADLTTSPYSISWNTTTAGNGGHTLTAIARDTSGNRTTSTAVPVTVSNTVTGPPTSGLIGYWNLDEDSGTIAHDTSSSGYNGTVNNAAWVAGKINSALSFTGNSSDVVTPGIPLGSTFSVSAWVNSPVTQQGEYARVAETQYSPGFYLGTNFAGTGYKFIVNGAAGATANCGLSYGCAEGGSVSIGWHLLTATFDGATARLYVDGVLVGSDTGTAANTNLPLYIGRYFASNGFGWNGAIDEVRLYNRALSAAEVTAILNYTGGGAPPDTTPPAVSITAPAANATVSNTITVSANASDNVAVADVQFQLDGVNLGADLTTAPYSISWNTTLASNGTHTLTAIAHDTSGNKTTSTPVTVTVSNTVGSIPTAGLIGYWSF
ncbi:MAG TPA: Ig-like domain-containing protein, partial [Bryobacteraceae bacterium]|nr:Ig-like domain-containing protein [Bryobacteraceae bacterium]